LKIILILVPIMMKNNHKSNSSTAKRVMAQMVENLTKVKICEVLYTTTTPHPPIHPPLFPDIKFLSYFRIEAVFKHISMSEP